jgi:hypothetical protein
MWANDATGLPSGELTAPLPRSWDYCFRDLLADPVVRWPDELELTVSSGCKDWVIYDVEDAGICVEPWTAPPNSLNMPNQRLVTPDAPLVAIVRMRNGAPLASMRFTMARQAKGLVENQDCGEGTEPDDVAAVRVQ